MSDIAIEFRVKNGRLKRAILAKWDSYAAFCRANHISYTGLNDLLGMRKKAHTTDDWRPLAMDIATALHMEPEELWPAEMRWAALSINSGEFAITLEEAAQLPSRDKINKLALTDLLKVLNPRELRAVTALAKGETYDESGKGLGWKGGNISRERARQVAMKAIRKMRGAAYREGIEFSDVVEAP